MHIRSGFGNVPKRRSFEGSSISFNMSLLEAADIFEGPFVSDAFSGVVEFAVRKEGILGTDGVAGSAVASMGIEEDCQAARLLRCESVAVAPELIAIEGRVPTEQGPFEASQRIFDAFESDVVGSEGLAKQGRIDGVVSKLRDRDFVGLVHLHGIRHGRSRLRFKSQGATIPELEGLIGHVEKSWGVADSDGAAYSF